MQAGPVSADVDEATTISIFFFSAAICCTASATEDKVRSADHVDAFDVVPAARDGGGEIELVLVVGVDQLDLLPEHAAAKILDRHLRGFDRPLAVKIGVGPGLIGENADLDALR